MKFKVGDRVVVIDDKKLINTKISIRNMHKGQIQSRIELSHEECYEVLFDLGDSVAIYSYEIILEQIFLSPLYQALR